MKYRKLSNTGDYTFGQGQTSLYIDSPQAVGQAVQTRLTLFQGAFWRDINEGLPLFQEILGKPGSPSNLKAIDELIKSRIEQTQGVTTVLDYSSTFSPESREYNYQATVQTDYSVTVVSGTL